MRATQGIYCGESTTCVIVPFLVKQHVASIVIECVRQIERKCLQHGKTLKIMRPDAESVERLEELAQAVGITIETNGMEHHKQNTAERYIQILPR